MARPRSSAAMRARDAVATECGTVAGSAARAARVDSRVGGAANAKPTVGDSSSWSARWRPESPTTAISPPYAEAPVLSPWPSSSVAGPNAAVASTGSPAAAIPNAVPATSAAADEPSPHPIGIWVRTRRRP